MAGIGNWLCGDDFQYTYKAKPTWVGRLSMCLGHNSVVLNGESDYGILPTKMNEEERRPEKQELVHFSSSRHITFMQ